MSVVPVGVGVVVGEESEHLLVVGDGGEDRSGESAWQDHLVVGFHENALGYEGGNTVFGVVGVVQVVVEEPEVVGDFFDFVLESAGELFSTESFQ